jgi:hypothetical protein
MHFPQFPLVQKKIFLSKISNTTKLSSATYGLVAMWIYNCHVDERSLHIWFATSADNWNQWHYVGPQYSQWQNGTCLIGKPFVFGGFQSGNYFFVVADDPPNGYCDIDDPNIVTCHRWESGIFAGQPGGTIWNTTVR